MAEVQIVVSIEPKRGMRVNHEAIVHHLHRLADQAIDGNSFLRDCGVTVTQGTDLVVAFAPKHGLRINEPAVAHLLKRLVEQRVDGSTFLQDCGIRLALEDTRHSTMTEKEYA